eukprot:SAG11_NODE_1072_length_5974_cov_1.634553_6_plen_137_part_00
MKNKKLHHSCLYFLSEPSDILCLIYQGNLENRATSFLVGSRTKVGYELAPTSSGALFFGKQANAASGKSGPKTISGALHVALFVDLTSLTRRTQTIMTRFAGGSSRVFREVHRCPVAEACKSMVLGSVVRTVQAAT